MNIDIEALYLAARTRAIDAWRNRSSIDMAAALSDIRAIERVLQQMWAVQPSAEMSVLLSAVSKCAQKLGRTIAHT